MRNNSRSDDSTPSANHLSHNHGWTLPARPGNPCNSSEKRERIDMNCRFLPESTDSNPHPSPDLSNNARPTVHHKLCPPTNPIYHDYSTTQSYSAALSHSLDHCQPPNEYVSCTDPGTWNGRSPTWIQQPPHITQNGFQPSAMYASPTDPSANEYYQYPSAHHHPQYVQSHLSANGMLFWPDPDADSAANGARWPLAPRLPLDPRQPYADESARVPPAQLLQIVLALKDVLSSDLRMNWQEELTDYLFSRKKAANDNKSTALSHWSYSPFRHVVTYLLIPPARLRYIHPAITDACLYAMRTSEEKDAHFGLATTKNPGFDNSIRTDWLIALIGLFYYAFPHLRLQLAEHYCTETLCWICELSFVFRSLDVERKLGRGRPVRVDRLCEALMRSAPITLGLAKSDNDPEFNPALGAEENRITQRIRMAQRLTKRTSPWIRVRALSLSGPAPFPSYEASSLAERHRARVAKMVRRTEKQRKADRDQVAARHKLHHRCHQVLNYLLHAFGGLKKRRDTATTVGDMFCIDMDTVTCCRAESAWRYRSAPTSRQAAENDDKTGGANANRSASLTRKKNEAATTTVSTPTYTLEIDHSAWQNFQESNDVSASSTVTELSSYPASAAESLQQSNDSRPPSVGSPKGLDEGSRSSSLEAQADATNFGASNFGASQAKGVTFCDMLKSSLWRRSSMQMTCRHCSERFSGRSSAHILMHRVMSLPSVLALKVRVTGTHSGEEQKPRDNLRFWRNFARPVHLPWKRKAPYSGKLQKDRGFEYRLLNSLFIRGSKGKPQDDGDMCRLLNEWLKQKKLAEKSSEYHRNRMGAMKLIRKALHDIVVSDLSQLPSRIWVKRTDNGDTNENPWQVSPFPLTEPEEDSESEGVIQYDVAAIVISTNYTWSRTRRRFLTRLWMQEVEPVLRSRWEEAAMSCTDQEGSETASWTEDTFESVFQMMEAEEVGLEAPPNDDQLITYVRVIDEDSLSPKWYMINGPATCEVSEVEAKQFCVPWKFPVAIFYAQRGTIWSSSILDRMPPPPPRLPGGLELFSQESISQTPLAMRHHPRFLPLTADEITAVKGGKFVAAVDAEHVVVDLLKKSHSSILAPHPALALGRMSLIRANGGSDEGMPFLDHYGMFREEPIDYRTEFSGLYPGDLDLKGSSHWLASQKQIYQVMRYLVEHKCRFVGHDLFNDFRVLGCYVPQDQIIDTVEIYRKSLTSRFLSLKFLCHNVLNSEIQKYTHDSIEDAQAALALYRFYQQYISLHSEEDFRIRFVEQLYRTGYQTNFKVVCGNHF